MHLELILDMKKSRYCKHGRSLMSIVTLSIFWSFAPQFSAFAQLKTGETLGARETSKAARSSKPEARPNFFSPLLKNPDSQKVDPDQPLKLEKYEQRYDERQKNYLKDNASAPADSMSLMGGVDTGGGTIVEMNGVPVLLDLFQFQTWQRNTQKGLTISLSPEAASCQMETFDYRQLPHSGYLSDLLDPLFENLGREALAARPQFTFINRQLGPKALDPKIYTRDDLSGFKLIPAAIYLKGQGVLVSLPEINRLSLRDQLGLLVHEVLRHISIGLELAISDQELQKLTASLTQKRATSSDIKKIREEFEKLGLPEQIFAGELTPYILRADLNYLCAMMEGRGKKTGNACRTLKQTRAEDVTQILPRARQELVDSYFEGSEEPRADLDQSWKNMLRWAHRYRQDRGFFDSSQRLHYLELFSKPMLSVADLNPKACREFTQALLQENLITADPR